MTKRHEVFVTEYLKHFNASEAARTAGYSERTAGEQASRLLKDARIKAAIDRRYREIIGPMEKHIKDVIHTFEDVMLHAEKDSDRVAAARWLGQYAKMFTERVEHTGKDGAPLTVEFVTNADSESD